MSQTRPPLLCSLYPCSHFDWVLHSVVQPQVRLETGVELKAKARELHIFIDDELKIDASDVDHAREIKTSRLLQESAALLASSPCVQTAAATKSLSAFADGRVSRDEEEYATRTFSKDRPVRQWSRRRDMRSGTAWMPWDWNGALTPKGLMEVEPAGGWGLWR